MLTKGRLHSIQIHPGAANLDLPVLAAHPLQHSVGPLAYQISSPEQAKSGRGIALMIATRATERHVRAAHDQFPHFAWRRVASIFVDQRQAVARERIADGNSRVI